MGGLYHLRNEKQTELQPSWAAVPSLDCHLLLVQLHQSGKASSKHKLGICGPISQPAPTTRQFLYNLYFWKLK